MTGSRKYPRFGMIKQCFQASADIQMETQLDRELERTGLLNPIKTGDKVLLTAGSRGIESKPAVLAALVQRIKALNARPFIFPAMGSHGGATAPGQVEVLAKLGITESLLGAPIYSDWQSVKIATVKGKVPVLVDRAALEADHIVLVNRVKEHTDFIGSSESGLLKIAVIGLGRRPGAEIMHRMAVDKGYLHSIQTLSKEIIANLNVLGGVALLEDHSNRLRRLEAVPAPELFQREPELLQESRKYKPGLPFDALDVLIVQEIGKEISGTGADTKVVGRIMNRFEKECSQPFIKRLVILDLSGGTYGNAIGIGLADYTTRRLVKKTDFAVTAINCITGGRPELGRMPIALANDQEALDTALGNIGFWTPKSVRVAWIKNTKELECFLASEALLNEAARRDDLALADEPFALDFNGRGTIATPWQNT
ncbi:MAG: DUF362 domain-containing protein [Desulfarculaceae bacterium]|jgi:hypothetical protein